MANAPKSLPTSRELAYVQTIGAAAKRLGLTQTALAARAGISQPQVSRILSGERPVTLNELLDLLDAVGLDLADVARDVG